MADIPRIPLVDHIRGLAAMSVAWFHLTNTYDHWARETGSWGWLGVEAFFVLSGFIIPYSIAISFPNYGLRDYPYFISRRMIRLEPPYIVSIALIIVLTMGAAQLPQFRGTTEGVLDYGRLGAHILYVIPLTDHSWLQPVYWTLAAEFAFYIAIGLLFPLVAGKKRLGTFLAISAVLCLAVAIWGLPARTLLFVMGVATFRFVLDQDELKIHRVVLVACGLSMAVEGLVVEGIVGVLVALLIANHRRLPSIPPGVERSLAGLGVISYSLYLIHVPIGGRIVNIGGRFVEGAMSSLILSLFALAVSIGASVVFWYLFERSAQGLSRRITRRRPSATSAFSST